MSPIQGDGEESSMLLWGGGAAALEGVVGGEVTPVGGGGCEVLEAREVREELRWRLFLREAREGSTDDTVEALLSRLLESGGRGAGGEVGESTPPPTSTGGWWWGAVVVVGGGGQVMGDGRSRSLWCSRTRLCCSSKSRQDTGRRVLGCPAPPL